MAALLAPFPNHAVLLALVVLLGMFHTALSTSDHSHFARIAGGGNAASFLSRQQAGGNSTNGTDAIAGGPVPAPPGLSTGCGCSPAPAPSDFENSKLAALYDVIQRFKKTITCDPLGVTNSWVGTKLCDSSTGGDMYKGFYCDYLPNSPESRETHTIASIDFNGYGICAPTIAGFIDEFPDLALFHANSNNFSGTVPDLRALPYLYELDFSNNNFSGPFPDNVLPLGRLLFLDLRFNRFFGSVPAPVFALTVEALFLNNNGFYGHIPDSFGSTTAQYLVVANNQFTGPIPRSIYNTSATLSEVLFLNNRLSGCLPYEIGLVQNLTVFDAGGNEITGPIPLSFGCLDSLEQLNLARNGLYGNVPDVLCELAKTGKLQNLSLSENYFHSVGHSCMELARSGVLDVRHNCIAGFPNQRPAIECIRFYADPTNHCPFIPHIPCNLPGFKPLAAAAAAALPDHHQKGSGN